MDEVSKLAEKVRRLQKYYADAERAKKEAKETTLFATQGIYRNGAVEINGKTYSYSLASKQIRLVNGFPVYCLPSLGDKNRMVIVGGGAP